MIVLKIILSHHHHRNKADEMDSDYWSVLLVDGRDRFPVGMKQVVVDKRQSGRFDGKDQRAIA